MSHPAGPPRLAIAAAAFVVASLSVVSVPSVRAQSQDTTGHNGWGIVYSSPRSRQQAAGTTGVTATPASAPSGSASGAATNGATSPTGKAATGWANGAGAASAPAPQPAASGASSTPYVSSYTPTLTARAPDPAPSSAAPAPAAGTAGAPAVRVPGVVYSSNGAVAYTPPPKPADPPPPPPTFTPAPATNQAPPPAYQAAPAPAYQPAPPTYQPAPAAQPTYAQQPAAAPTTYPAPAPAPATYYQGAPYPAAPAAADPAQGPPRVQPYPAQNYAPAAPQSYPAPTNTAQAYYSAPVPAAPAPAYNGANQYPYERPTNLPPTGRTDASYDVDTNPPPGGAPAPVASLPGGPAGGASSSSIHLDELMSLHEWESSGVSRLKPQEIATLEKWLERYRQQVADSVTRAFGAPHATGQGSNPIPPISRTSDGTPKNAHAVTAIRSGSRYITLDDGSVWDVYPSDQTETAAWQQGDLVQVRVAPVAYGEFDHELVNNQRTGPVRAKFMGYAARQ